MSLRSNHHNFPLLFPSGHRLQSTTLQHYVLHVFKKMLEGTPTVVNLFRKDGVWDLVFSEWFFYFGFGDLNRSVEKERKSGPKIGDDSQSTSKIQKASTSDVNISTGNLNPRECVLSIHVSSDTEPLRLEVISFLELAATTSALSDNLVIIGRTYCLFKGAACSKNYSHDNFVSGTHSGVLNTCVLPVKRGFPRIHVFLLLRNNLSE